MKTKLTFWIILSLVITVASCSSDNGPVEGPNHHRNSMMTMRLKLAGEFIEESDVPMTRTFTNTPGSRYAGINVLHRNKGTATYTRYAYGVFDNLDAIYLNVYSDEEYKFEVTVIKNYTDLLQLESGKFSNPFRKNTTVQYLLSDVNIFKYSSSDYLSQINVGTALALSVVDENDKLAKMAYQYPRMHRFYGTKEGVEFSSSADDVISIDLQYQCFGIQINASDVPEGATLTWQEANYNANSREKYLRFGSDAAFTYDADKNESDGYHWEDVYSLNSFSSATKSSTLRFTLTKADGSKITFDKSITLTRGQKKILNVVFDGNYSTSGSRISIGSLDESMIDEPAEEVRL